MREEGPWYDDDSLLGSLLGFSASSPPFISCMTFPFLLLPFVKILNIWPFKQHPCPIGGQDTSGSEHLGQTKFIRATHVLEPYPWLGVEQEAFACIVGL